MKCLNHVKYELCPFAVSLHGTFGKSALSFLDDFSKLVSLSHKKIFALTLWNSPLVFTIFKRVPTMIDRSLEAVSVSLDNRAKTRTVDTDICFDDIDF
ncbi:hypothetical protein RCL1_006991 [Eukaryota sp. TZLM3-RCL]